MAEKRWRLWWHAETIGIENLIGPCEALKLDMSKPLVINDILDNPADVPSRLFLRGRFEPYAHPPHPKPREVVRIGRLIMGEDGKIRAGSRVNRRNWQDSIDGGANVYDDDVWVVIAFVEHGRVKLFMDNVVSPSAFAIAKSIFHQKSVERANKTRASAKFRKP